MYICYMKFNKLLVEENFSLRLTITQFPPNYVGGI